MKALGYLEELNQAKEFAAESGRRLVNLRLKGDLRTRLAASCFAVAQDQYNAILILLGHQSPLHASALSLLRPIMDSVIRGLWLLNCAPENELEAYLKDEKKFLKIKNLMAGLKDCFANKSPASVFIEKWNTLSSFVHCGGLQIQYWIQESSISSMYPDDVIKELIERSTQTYKLSLAGLDACRSDEPKALSD